MYNVIVQKTNQNTAISCSLLSVENCTPVHCTPVHCISVHLYTVHLYTVNLYTTPIHCTPVHLQRCTLYTCTLCRSKPVPGKDPVSLASEGKYYPSLRDLAVISKYFKYQLIDICTTHIPELERFRRCRAARCSLLYCTVLYCMILYCTVLYCTELN